MGKRVWLDCAIWGAGAVYVALVLTVNLESPLFGLLLIGAAGYKLVEPRRHKRGSR